MIKLQKSFIRGWHKRYLASLEEGNSITGALQDGRGCMCALGIGYNMMVEAGHGKWVGDTIRRYTCPEMYDETTGNASGFVVALGINGCEPYGLAFARIMRLHDIRQYEEAATAILELEQYAED